MLVTNRDDIYRRCLFLRDHGRKPGDKLFYNTEIAYKYKMSSMQATLGLAQLERVEELVERKRQIFSWYQSELANIKGITLNYEAPETKNTYWMVTVILDKGFGITKEQMIELMSKKNIDCRPFFHPLSSLPAYNHIEQAQQARLHNHTSYQISPYGINLPSGLNMTKEKVKAVCQSLLQIWNNYENT
jgi:perosamine synthetase